MYRTGDPRFRRRLNEIGQTLENANESAQSGIYIFGRDYVRPCFESVTSCVTTCVDASCPSLNLSQRDRLRRQRGQARSRGRAELSFDFYDDWDDDEHDGLLGWGNDEFDRLLAGPGGYGTVTDSQPARQRGMSYPRGRRRSAGPTLDIGSDPTVTSGSSFFGKLFGGKALRYKPSAAGLQEHPGARRLGMGLTEGEALLEENEQGEGAIAGKKHRRVRSNTVESGETTDSFSSRGDLFPSDEETDAIPLDDEFAMVLERRATQSGPETETSSGKTRDSGDRKRGKRPSAGSRRSTRRTASSRSTRSSIGRRDRSRRNSSAPDTPTQEMAMPMEEDLPTFSELKREERETELEEEAEIERKRQEAQRLAAERGLVDTDAQDASSKEATPRESTPTIELTLRQDEPSQLPPPLTTNDEHENARLGETDKATP